MFRRLIFLPMVLVFCAGAAQGYTILVVSDCQLPGVAGGDHEDDELVSFLEGLGHTVDTSGMNQACREGNDPFSDPTLLGALNNADLVLVSRRPSSGSYDSDRTNWNGLETPLLLMSGYFTRGGGDNRWHWTSCGSADAGNTVTTIDVEAGQEGHPFLTGLIGPIQVFDWSTAPTAGQAPKGVYLPSCDFVAGTTLIGRFDGRPMLADIPKGTTLANGDIAGERRVFLGHWGYDIDLAAPFNREANFDDFITEDYKTLLTNVINDILGIGFDRAKASNPNPANQDPDAPYKVVLRWTPGAYVPATNGHKVYFSENLDDVSNGIGGTIVNSNRYPASGTLSLDFSTTYYWRVDEANVPTSGWDEGDIWRFTTEPIAYPMPGQTITATASSVNNANEGPENTINGSGLNADDLHSIELTDMWLSNAADTNAAWIQYEFDGAYKLYQMLVWNHNTALEPGVGFGIQDATIEYSINGVDWSTLGTTHEFTRAPGAPDYAHDTKIDFEGAVAKYVKITANSNWGILAQYGLSEVLFFYIPVRARQPNPADGATDVAMDMELGWRLGREAAEHEVYLSTKRQAVRNGTALAGTVTETSYGPLSLHLGRTYYWKINEVNMAEIPTTWDGDVWSFSTPAYLVVEDFEDYDDLCNRIFYTWQEGWGYSGDPACGVPPFGGNGSGSTVGYLDAPYAEQTITHDGSRQSMPFEYLNDGSTGKALYSETGRLFDPAQDWTRRGAKALTLWFRGYPGSVGSFNYDPATGIYMMTANGWDIWATSDGFHYAFKRLSGLGSIQVQVRGVSSTNEWTKAGLMIRETLDANSVYASALITPPDALHGVRFQIRATTGGSTTRTFVEEITAPQWLRLERGAGDTYTVSYSPDGSAGSWTQVGEPVIVAMSTNVYIGLALSSHTVDAMATAEFSDVTTTGAVTGQWQSQDIGITTNDAEQLYVVVEDSAGRSKVVNHEDPNATVSDTWQEWNIDLEQVSNASVNLQSVKKMYIGVGDRDNPKLGGAGMLYIDDIRFNPATCVLSRRSADFARLDFVEDCEVNYRELETMAGVWLQSSPWDVDGGYDGSGCLHFDGVDDQVYAAEASIPTSAFTIALWFNSDVALDSSNPRADFVYWQSPARPHVTFNRSGTGEIGVWPAISGDFDGPLTTTNSWSADTWYFIVGTFDGTDFKIYVGQDLENTLNHPGAHDAASGLFIGSNRGNGNNFDGKIDDLRIYDYALSGAEITKLANATGEPVIGPVIWYKFDEASGNIAHDSSGNGNDAEVLFDRLAANLYEDNVVDLKDFAVLADSWLEQELWP